MTPGLIDCHTHLVYGGNRAGEFEMRLAGASYLEISAAGGGIRSTVAATRAASEDTLFAAAAARLRVLMSEGVTTVEVKSGYGLDRDAERRMLRVARRLGEVFPVTVTATYLGGHTVPVEFAGDAAGYVDLVCAMIGEIARERSADAVDVCYDPIGFDRTQSERMLAAARAHGLPVKLHTGQFASQGGGALAAAYNALSADHVEHLSEDDIVAMAKAGTVAVLLPGAFYFIRETKKPPVELLRRHRVPIALASDHNPGTSPLLSPILVMNMGSILFGLTPAETLAGVTRNAARALGLAKDRGTIEAAKRADLAIWSIERPAELGYAIGSRPPAAVVQSGRVVLNGEALGPTPGPWA
jgi:imidazolonepropionase